MAHRMLAARVVRSVLSKVSAVELYYATSKNGNFGDDMNLWFWDHFLPGWRDHDPDVTLFGIGSILGTGVVEKHGKVLVCGSGSGYGRLGPLDPQRVRISWVRGPLTARLLGLEDEVGISDPAALLSVMPRFAGMSRGGGGAIFIPHRSTAQLDMDWDRLGRACDVRVVLPNQAAEKVIDRIVGADMVVTESMHGAIMADAFRVPWAPIRISNQFNDHKWNDWAMGLGLTLDMPESLRGPKQVFRMATALKSRMRRMRSQQPRPLPAMAGQASAHRSRMPETGGFDLGEDGRQQVKKLFRLAAPVIERALAADIRRAMQRHVHLSVEGRTEVLVARMLDRLDDVQKRLRAPS